MIDRRFGEILSPSAAAAKYGEKEKPPKKDSTLQTIGFLVRRILQEGAIGNGEFAVFERLPEYRQAAHERYFTGFTEEIRWTGSETECEKWLMQIIDAGIEKAREEKARDTLERRLRKLKRKGKGGA